MRRVSTDLLRRIGEGLSREDRDEMAIPSYLHHNPGLRFMAYRRLEVVAARLARLLSRRPRPRVVLDFGCGAGVLLPEIRSHAEQIYGVDLVLSGAERVVAELSLGEVTLLHPDRMAETVADRAVDLIVAAEVLEHVDDVSATMREFARALKPDGRLLVSLPTENALYQLGRKIAGFSGHYHHANAASIDAAICAAGFRRTWRRQIPAPGPLAIYWVLDYAR